MARLAVVATNQKCPSHQPFMSTLPHMSVVLVHKAAFLFVMAMVSDRKGNELFLGLTGKSMCLCIDIRQSEQEVFNI